METVKKSNEPIWNSVVRKTVYDCPMPEDGEMILVAYGEGIRKPDRCIIQDGEYLLASGGKWSDISAWQTVSDFSENNKVAQLFEIFVEATDVDSEYDDAYKMYTPKGLDKFLGTKRRKISERVVNDLALVEPLREIIRDSLPNMYCNINDNYSFFDDTLRIMANLIKVWYIDLSTTEEMKRAGIVLYVRLWEISVLASIDKVREIWNEYDKEFGDETPFKVD